MFRHNEKTLPFFDITSVNFFGKIMANSPPKIHFFSALCWLLRPILNAKFSFLCCCDYSVITKMVEPTVLFTLFGMFPVAFFITYFLTVLILLSFLYFLLFCFASIFFLNCLIHCVLNKCESNFYLVLRLFIRGFNLFIRK